MKRRTVETIGDLVRRYLRQQGLESPLNEQKLIKAWPELLGPAIGKYTEDLFIRDQTLYVHLTSSVLRQELMMGRQSLIRNLNAKVGATVITNIVFR
jgi:predicted nucleic acid-binding Zn ribbon protein